MGCEFDYFKTKAKTRKEVEEVFEREQENAAYDDGHNYSGRINMAPGLEFHDKVFNTENEAYDYVDATAKKWENAIAVQFKDKNGELVYFVGAMCSS